MDQIFGMGRLDIKNKLNTAKIKVSKMGVLPKQCPQKLELFNLLGWTHETFKVTKSKEKIKFDKIKHPPQMRPPKF